MTKLTLSDFKRKYVRGLYSYDHFEAADGSFIQIRQGSEFRADLRLASGERITFETREAFQAYFA